MGSGISSPKLFSPPGAFNTTQDGGALATPNNTASGTAASPYVPYTPPPPAPVAPPVTANPPQVNPRIPGLSGGSSIGGPYRWFGASDQ